MTEVTVIEQRSEASIAPKPRTPSMIIAETTNPTERQLIDFFSRLSTRQREALYAMHGYKQLERVNDRWCAPGHRPFIGKIIACLCDDGLARISIFREGGRSVMAAMLSPSGKRLMKAVQALDAVFFQNIAEIGAGT